MRVSKDSADRHNSFADGNLALFTDEADEIFHVDIEEPRASLMDGIDDVCADAVVWPTSIQHPMRGSIPLTASSTVRGEGQILSSGP